MPELDIPSPGPSGDREGSFVASVYSHDSNDILSKPLGPSAPAATGNTTDSASPTNAVGADTSGTSEDADKSEIGSKDDTSSLEAIESLHRIATAADSVHSREEEMSQIISRTTVRSYTAPLPVMGGNKKYPPLIGDREQFRVEFDGPDDPLNPLNWGLLKKIVTTGIAAYPSMVVGWGSSSIAPGLEAIKAHWHVGTPVAALTVTVYVTGFALGPIFWGPVSEISGRKMPLIVSSFLFTCFAFATATAKDYQTLVISRFFMGACGSAPLAVVPALMADIYNTLIRGQATSIFILTVVAGPMLSPVVGGFITFSYLGWRWTQYITGIMAALGLVLLFFAPETYHAKVLSFKARELRERTGNWAIYSTYDTLETDVKTIAHVTLIRPIFMLFVEPVLTILTIYHGIVYGIIYLCLEGIPYTFGRYYYWQKGVLFLPYLGMLVGTITSMLINIFVFEPIFRKQLVASGKPVEPELRLPLAMFGSIIFPLGIFLFVWSAKYQAFWFVPVVGVALIGVGTVAIFLGLINYIVDCYLMVVASAIAANTLVRSCMAAAFPLFATPMFKNMDVQWAGTLLGCIAFIVMPFPFFLYKFGPWVRRKSRYATTLDKLIEAKKSGAI